MLKLLINSSIIIFSIGLISSSSSLSTIYGFILDVLYCSCVYPYGTQSIELFIILFIVKAV
ncbi:MAG: hypothetical protein ACKPKO_36525 [Candidatus Fonsibacter sp.]